MKKPALLSLICIMLFCQNAFAQTTPIRGTVLDETGAPLPGASIKIKGTQSGSITDMEGQFQVEVPDGQEVLLFEAVGYYPRKKSPLEMAVVRLR